MTAVITQRETLFTKVIGKLLPDRMKRVIFISSFIANINDCKNPDKVLLTKINNLLTLCSGDGGMVFPMQMHSKIWNEDLVKEVFINKDFDITSLKEIAAYSFSKGQARSLSEELVKNTPSWLKYSSNTKMKLDLVKVLVNLKQLIGSDPIAS